MDRRRLPGGYGRRNQYTGILYEERGRGILAKRGEQLTIDRDGKKESRSRFGDADELAKAIHMNDWNEYVVEARGARLKHTINGKLMSETIDHDREHRAAAGVFASAGSCGATGADDGELPQDRTRRTGAAGDQGGKRETW